MLCAKRVFPDKSMPPTTSQMITKGIILAFVAFFIFIVSDISVKLLEGELPVYEAAFLGSVMGLLCLPVLKNRNERLSDIFKTTSKPLWIIRFIFYPAGVIGSVTAFTYLSMAEAFVLIFLMPAYITIIGLFWLKEPVDRRRWAALLIGFVGVLIVLRPGFRELSIGHLGAIAAGLGGAVTVLCTRSLGTREPRIALLGAGFLGGTIICGAFAIPEFIWPTMHQWGLLLGYGLLAVLGSWMVMKAALLAPGAYIGPTQYSQMAWAILLDYLVFGTSVDAAMIIGIILIVGSGLFTVLGPSKRSGQSSFSGRRRNSV